MKNSFRQCMAWLHTWTGLTVGWVLFFVFVTGTAGYFHYEINRWMRPELPLAKVQPAVVDRAQAVETALRRLQQAAPGAATWRIELPHYSVGLRTWRDLTISWEEMPQPGSDRGALDSEALDAASGDRIAPDPEPRATAGGTGLYRMHWMLHYMPQEVGIWIVGISTMFMLVAIISGIVSHKKIFKDFFTFRPGRGHRSWLDAHNIVSVMALPFFLMITYSGLVFFLFTYMPAGRDVVYGPGAAGQKAFFDAFRDRHAHQPVATPKVDLAPLFARADAEWGPDRVIAVAIAHEQGEPPTVTLAQAATGTIVDYRYPTTLRFHADSGEPLSPETPPHGSAGATYRIMLDLHEGRFVTIWGRWLYFAAGLLGCAMIGTGLVVWTAKRRRHHLSSGREAEENFGVRLVEILNISTIAGLPLAVAAYFWANRLLPVALGDRAAWEFHSLFAVWLGALFYAIARPPQRAWIELLWAACAAYALVPLINALTTARHLGRSLAAGDWVLAGFDLTMLGLAAMLALMALKVQRRLAPARSGRYAVTPAMMEKGPA